MYLTFWQISSAATLRSKWNVIVPASFAVVVRAFGRATTTMAAVAIATWCSRVPARVAGCPITGASPIPARASGAIPH